MMKLSLYTILSTCISFFSCVNHKKIPVLGKNTINWNLGRFEFQLPNSVVLQDASYVLNYIDIKLIDNANNDLETYWQKYLQDIASKKQYRELDDDKQGEIVAVKEISPELRTVIFHEYDNPQIISCCAIKKTAFGFLKLQIDGDLDKQEIWYQNLLNLAKEYNVDNTRENKAFNLHRGHFLSSKDYNKEEISINFTDTVNHLKLKLYTSSFEEKEDENFLEKGAKLLMQRAGLATLNIKTLREKSRKVAGIKGYELILKEKSAKRDKLFFLFHAKGEHNSVTKPEIKIEMEAGGLSEEQYLNLWDAILDGVNSRE